MVTEKIFDSHSELPFPVFQRSLFKKLIVNDPNKILDGAIDR